MSAPERRKRLAVIGAGVAVAAAGLVFAIASRSDDQTIPAAVGPTAINSGASTDLTLVGAEVSPIGSDDPTTTLDPEAFTRALFEPGMFDCVTTGLWQPYEDLQLVLQVGEPAADTPCPENVLQLPSGYCSTAPCTEVPDDWEIRFQDGVPAQQLLLVVAPDSATTARFYCFRDLLNEQALFYPMTTTIEEACPAPPPDSIDIPYVPPATSDIPYVPPTESVDIPEG